MIQVKALDGFIWDVGLAKGFGGGYVMYALDKKDSPLNMEMRGVKGSPRLSKHS